MIKAEREMPLSENEALNIFMALRGRKILMVILRKLVFIREDPQG